MDPFTAVMLGSMVVGTYLQAKGATDDANAQAASAMYNRGIALKNAQISEDQTREAVRRFRIGTQKDLGQIRATAGASGTTLEGTPMQILEDTASTAELDALTIQYQGALQAMGYRDEATGYSMQAGAAQTRGRNARTAAILSGVTNAGYALAPRGGK